MNPYIEQRKEQRFDSFWLIYLLENDQFLGYLIDLSESGMKVWCIQQNLLKQLNFAVKIIPPREIEMEHMIFDIKVVWEDIKDHHSFVEIGCNFINLAQHQLDNITLLINTFSKDKDIFFNEIEKYLTDIENSTS